MTRASFIYAGLGAKGAEVYVRPCGCRVLRWRVRVGGGTVESLEVRSCEGQILLPRTPAPRWPHETGEWIRDWAIVYEAGRPKP
jgi:hypothetical protein